MRHCPTSLCSSNGQMLWPSKIRDEHLHVFQWILPAFIQHNNVNYLRWGTIYLKNPSNFTGNLDRAWGSKFGVNHSSHQSNQLDLDQKYEWLNALVQREGCNRNHHQVLDLLSLHLHMISVIMLGMCAEHVKTCVQNNRPELCCHHSPWDIVLHTDVTQMGNCCHPQNTW